MPNKNLKEVPRNKNKHKQKDKIDRKKEDIGKQMGAKGCSKRGALLESR